jgi:general secretion pathway protein G
MRAGIGTVLKGTQMHRHKSVQAFTLIELLLVLVILGVLAAIVVPPLVNRPRDAKERATVMQISVIKTSLGTFNIDNSRYPSTEEGLEALVNAPAELVDSWKGPYLPEMPADGWGRPFVYRLENGGTFFLLSFGADGAENTADDINQFTRK